MCLECLAEGGDPLATERETAVVLLQTAHTLQTDNILAEAKSIVDRSVSELESRASAEPFVWPAGVLHVLGILQAGLVNSRDGVPTELQFSAATLLGIGSKRGNLLDRKLALEVAAVAPVEKFTAFIRDALVLESEWINNITYRQIARLSTIPSDIFRFLCLSIFEMATRINIDWRRNYDVLYAQLSKVKRSDELIKMLHFGYFMVLCDLTASIMLIV
jgi:hypothetical protein